MEPLADGPVPIGRRRRWRRLFWLGLGSLGGAAVLIAWLGMLGRHMLYPAPSFLVGEAPAPLLEVRLLLADGTPVIAWAGPRRRGEGRPAVLYLHGNGENLGTLAMSGLFAELDRLGVDYLAVDYPGYGRSGGQPSEASLVEAASVGLTHLRERSPEAPAVIVGWSLGAAVGIQLAAQRQEEVSALVLLSAWDTLVAVGSRLFPQSLVRLGLGQNRYDSLAAATSIGCPVLLAHGVEDRVIPLSHGERLHRRLAEVTEARFVTVPGTGHNDLLGRTVVWEELERLLEAVAGGPAG